VLDVEGLRTCYGGIVAIDAVTMQVPARRMVAIIGTNGAGKTTLLNTIAGVLRPNRGETRFEGTKISGLPAYKVSQLGVIQVPEGRQILGPLSVEENLRLGHIAARHRGGDMEGDIERALVLFPALRTRMKEAAGRLSGGQQQMLAIGRALMGRPKLLLLDEPSLGLSPIIVAQVFEALRRLHSEGLTIVLVEQNARLALAMADYGYVMERGRIVHDGPCEQLRVDPKITALYLGASGP
jgi:branched-chain amino acid transport system ATP-binding protein